MKKSGISTYTAQIILLAIILSLIPIIYINSVSPLTEQELSLVNIYEDRIKLAGVKLSVIHLNGSTIYVFNYGWRGANISTIYVNGSQVSYEMYIFNESTWVKSNYIPPHKIAKIVLTTNVSTNSDIVLKCDEGYVRV